MTESTSCSPMLPGDRWDEENRQVLRQLEGFDVEDDGSDEWQHAVDLVTALTRAVEGADLDALLGRESEEFEDLTACPRFDLTTWSNSCRPGSALRSAIPDLRSGPKQCTMAGVVAAHPRWLTPQPDEVSQEHYRQSGRCHSN